MHTKCINIHDLVNTNPNCEFTTEIMNYKKKVYRFYNKILKLKAFTLRPARCVERAHQS